jgi:threonyl-tRNA synthetase
MVNITLPDGSKRQFDSPVTVAGVAADIGPGLAKAALAGRVAGLVVDTSCLIETDVELSIVTDRDPEGLEVIRHSTAHLMAQAVQRLYQNAQVTIGPVIEDGFFYDFAYEPGFTPDDLTSIEDEMNRIVAEALPVERSLMARDEAVAFFRDMGEEYKARIVEDIPADQDISLYRQGEFIDLCRGPHVPNTSRLKAFKLTRLAGAYWRGDSNNEMLQRIYGTAWANKKDLKAYLYRLEEAAKRDHRRLGTQLRLFHMQEEAPGMVFWHDHGWRIYRQVRNYIRAKVSANGYQEISTPQIVDRSLWEKSGHWDKFRDEMFITSSESHDFAIKPMNCPCHVQVYNKGLHSYRELPLRMAEFGSCHRNEPSGALHGLMRVRNFVQDDAHIFCTEGQIAQEVANFHDQVLEVYRDFGFDEVLVKFSTRPENRVGDDALWDKAEQVLEQVLKDKGIDWELQPGDGAFYGPKIDYSLKDCLGRVWQCGTMQLDFSMPARLGATYIDEHGDKLTPVMLHRAMVGSLERFIGILIENYAGALPVWLAPVQAVVMNITDAQGEYGQKVTNTLVDQGFRVDSDLRNEKIGFKIRERTLQKVPYLLVVGDREVAEGTVAVRLRNGENLGAMPIAAVADLLRKAISEKAVVK